MGQSWSEVSCRFVSFFFGGLFKGLLSFFLFNFHFLSVFIFHIFLFFVKNTTGLLTFVQDLLLFFFGSLLGLKDLWLFQTKLLLLESFLGDLFESKYIPAFI